VRLHPHQVAGARRVLANRGGLLAFDVGVGKTYTGIAVLAQARQDGWCRRPVLLVPNSIVWKWEADIRRVSCPTTGSRHRLEEEGRRPRRAQGLVTSDTDTPAERADEVDALPGRRVRRRPAHLHGALPHAHERGRDPHLRRRHRGHPREVRLRQRNAAETKKLTERQAAILKEGVAAWIAEQMELPEGWEYDPGVAWDDIGVDLLIVDEAQNFKNLYLPEPREGGVPRFMGNAGEGSKRAWQLDFRCAAVRVGPAGRASCCCRRRPRRTARSSSTTSSSTSTTTPGRAWASATPSSSSTATCASSSRRSSTPRWRSSSAQAVVGFQNLHELREVIFRYGEFKTAEDVGLKLPEPKVNVVEVDMTRARTPSTTCTSPRSRRARVDRMADKAKILGLLARMALVAIHPDLDEGYDWKTARRRA
jgi:hypothetical protein